MCVRLLKLINLTMIAYKRNFLSCLSYPLSSLFHHQTTTTTCDPPGITSLLIPNMHPWPNHGEDCYATESGFTSSSSLEEVRKRMTGVRAGVIEKGLTTPTTNHDGVPTGMSYPSCFEENHCSSDSQHT